METPHVAYLQNPRDGKIERIEAPAAEISQKMTPLMRQGWVQVPEPREQENHNSPEEKETE